MIDWRAHAVDPDVEIDQKTRAVVVGGQANLRLHPRRQSLFAERTSNQPFGTHARCASFDKLHEHGHRQVGRVHDMGPAAKCNPLT